jgi:hypothetical protein
MKFFLMLTLVVSASCGRIENPISASGIGELRTISALSGVLASERTNLQLICDALARVETILPSAVNTNHTYLAGQTDCAGKFIENSNINVVIQAVNSGYVFRRQDGLEFLFPVFETASKGEVSSLCSALATNLTNPVVRENGSAVFFRTTGISANCPDVPGERCILLEQALPEGSLSYRIVSREWIRFRVDPRLTKAGFFSYRQRIARSYCPQNQGLVFEASLK